MLAAFRNRGSTRAKLLRMDVKLETLPVRAFARCFAVT